MSLIQTAEDLAEADKKRREEFKTYEMEKEFEKQQKLKELDEEKKKKYVEELEAQKQKHKKHDPVPVIISRLVAASFTHVHRHHECTIW